MEQVNLYPAMMEQLDYFIKKFISIGYKQEDLHYLMRNTNIITHPNSRNEKFKTQFGMSLYTELLSYAEDKKYMLTPWICCSITVTPEDIKYQMDSERLRSVGKLIQDDLKELGLKAFFDEDAFLYNFSRPELHKDLDSVKIKFYLNKHYPEGYWENHTIE